MRHAGAGTVACELLVARVLWWSRSATTGRGSPGTAPAGSGVGLASMRERAEELGGSLTVTGRPGRGHPVRAELPVGERP